MREFLLFIFFIGLGFNLSAQTEWEKTKATVDKASIRSHLYFLASDELKGRQTGSHEMDVAALYLAGQFRRYGVADVPGTDRPYMQEVLIVKSTAPAVLKIRQGDKEISTPLMIKGANMKEKGEAVFLEYGMARDYEGKEVEGKWIIVRAGSSESQGVRDDLELATTKRSLAKSLGALGLIELSEAEDKTWKSLGFYLNRPKTSFGEVEAFPHFWVQQKEIGQGEESLPDSLEVEISGIEVRRLDCQNVVGMVEGSDPDLKDEFIIYSAHYDHVGTGKPDKDQDSIFNGARDNAIGAVTVLSTAENLARYPSKRSALFILFTGEEMGLLGSRYYTEHPLLPLEQMVFCFNSDNAGYNDTSLATIIGLGRTTVSHHIKKAAKMASLKAIDDPAPEQNLFDRSDNVNFAKLGIPAPTYGLGFSAFDGEIMRFYHQRGDHANNLDFDYLLKFFHSYVLSGRYIGNDPETPFWTEGDKYYEAGIELYQSE